MKNWSPFQILPLYVLVSGAEWTLPEAREKSVIQFGETPTRASFDIIVRNKYSVVPLTVWSEQNSRSLSWFQNIELQKQHERVPCSADLITAAVALKTAFFPCLSFHTSQRTFRVWLLIVWTKLGQYDLSAGSACVVPPRFCSQETLCQFVSVLYLEIVFACGGVNISTL